MPVTASQLFDFRDKNQIFLFEKRVVSSHRFSQLRRNIRSIIGDLSQSDEDDAKQLCFNLRNMLYEWLSSPIPFDNNIIDSLKILGAPESIESRWGRDVRIMFEESIDSANLLTNTQNPFRGQIHNILNDTHNIGLSYRILCRKWTQDHFLSIDDRIDRRFFISSVKDYKDAEPFDVLIKVGPFYSRKYNAVPDAILTAPRFANLVQILWAGTVDELDFGYDPIADSSQIASGAIQETVTISIDEDMYDEQLDVDEFKLYNDMEKRQDRRRAVLVQVDDCGILYSLHAKVLGFDPTIIENAFYIRRLELISEGMFIIIPDLVGVDLGKNQVSYDAFSRIWKKRLNEEYVSDSDWLLSRLRNKGVNLFGLESAVDAWRKPATTVIHAPQSLDHFKALIEELEIDDRPLDYPPQIKNNIPWYQQAWNEIRRSRGEAIQAGFQTNEIIYSELIAILNRAVPQIKQLADQQNRFEYHLTGSLSLQGALQFFKVTSIEEGFMAPDSMLRNVVALKEAEQWRE